MQSQRATTADLSGLYDEDFFEWTRRNAQLLRAGQVRQSDVRHIAEAIEGLGKQDLKELHRLPRTVSRQVSFIVEQILDPGFLPRVQ